MSRGLFAVALMCASTSAGGCLFEQRDPEPLVCASIEPGALAISEVRKAASSDTTQVSWVELYNTTSAAIAMRGVALRFRNPTGASEIDVEVRRAFDAPAGAYITIGLVDDATRPDYIDYGILGQLGTTWPSDVALEVDTCGTKIDVVQYSSLPSMGTLSLDGASPPTADANDFAAHFCTDATLVGGAYPGTPRQPNIVCPTTP